MPMIEHRGTRASVIQIQDIVSIFRWVVIAGPNMGIELYPWLLEHLLQLSLNVIFRLEKSSSKHCTTDYSWLICLSITRRICRIYRIFPQEDVERRKKQGFVY